MMPRILRADQVFDGTTLHRDAAVSLTCAGRIEALHPRGSALPDPAEVTDLGNGILAPGLVDLQVNGGGGHMVGAGTNAAQLAEICAVHARLGACAILPTLITDRAEVTREVIAAARSAARDAAPGFAGLHLEGPHLDPARRGAHDARHIRPMTRRDVELLCEAAQTLPALMVTLAPEAASPEQVAELAAAGVIVSLGHTGCSAEAAHAACRAGARGVTHLYNAMGPMANRAPGLVGAALTSPLVVGIIADGVHVARECLLVALQMKAPDQLFLVSDAMAVAGTDLTEFTLGGRVIRRAQGRLTLADGTLAGADISLPQALAHLTALGVPTARALAMATRIPADLIGAQDRGRIAPGARGDLVLLAPNMRLSKVWLNGAPIEPTVTA